MSKKTTKVVQDKKKTFRCIGVDRGRMTMEKYASVIENELNDLADDGYVMKVFDNQERTTFILGKLRETEEEQPKQRSFMIPLGSMPLPGVTGFNGAPLSFKSNITPQIMKDVLNVSDQRRDGKDTLDEDVEAIAENLSKAVTAQDAATIIEDFEEKAKEHEETPSHKTDTSCRAPESFRKFAKALKTKMQLRLQ